MGIATASYNMFLQTYYLQFEGVDTISPAGVQTLPIQASSPDAALEIGRLRYERFAKPGTQFWLKREEQVHGRN